MSGKVREFFVQEASDCLDAIEQLLSDEGRPDATALLRHARTLRGSAQMAREDDVWTAARVLEAAIRALISRVLEWDDDVSRHARDTVADLRALVAGGSATPASEIVARTIERWRRPGVQLPGAPGVSGDLGDAGASGTSGMGPAPTAGASQGGAALGGALDSPGSAHPTHPSNVTEASGAAGGMADAGASRAAGGDGSGYAGSMAHAASAGSSGERDAFLAFAAREVSSILSALESALNTLARAPRDREPLKSILRCQRALLGSAQLDSLPAVAETLNAIDQICRLIARQDVAVQDRWYDFFRAARDVLADAAAALLEGEVPVRTPSVPRMAELRDALQAEYLGGHEVPTPPPPPIGAPTGAEAADFFRTEARLLLKRIERMAADLDTAPADREAVLRRELGATLEALRDTALTFGYARVGTLAHSARSRARGNAGSELLALLPNLSAAIEAAATADDDAVPIEDLLYRGEAALRRALQLRPVLETVLGNDARAREALDEIFDLMHLIRK